MTTVYLASPLGFSPEWKTYRDCGDFEGLPFNLQVLHWIASSGGRLFRQIEEITEDTFTGPR